MATSTKKRKPSDKDTNPIHPPGFSEIGPPHSRPHQEGSSSKNLEQFCTVIRSANKKLFGMIQMAGGLDIRHEELLEELRKTKLAKQEIEKDLEFVEAERAKLKSKMAQLNVAFKERYKMVSLEKSRTIEEMRAKCDEERERRVKAESELEAVQASLSGQIREAATKAVTDFKASSEFAIEYWTGIADCRDLARMQNPNFEIDFSFLSEETNRAAQVGTPPIDTPSGDYEM